MIQQLIFMILNLSLIIKGQQLTSIYNCQQNIFGCQTCDYQQINQTNYYNCRQCENNLYLYKYQNQRQNYTLPQSSTDNNINDYLQNICVSSCQLTDKNTFQDEYSKQCVYLGPLCQLSKVIQSSITNQPILSCLYSSSQNYGYINGQKFRIQNSYQSIQSINQTAMNIGTLDQLQQIYQMYNNPLQTTSLAINQTETNAKVVSKCINRECKFCNDFDLTSCVTCWGRFGDQNNNNACLQYTSCYAVGDLSFLNGCFQSSFDCLSCTICNIGYALQNNGRCLGCQSLDSNCADCSYIQNTDESQTFQCNICNNGYGWSLKTLQCTQCNNQNINQCSFDSQGNQSILSCIDGYFLNLQGTACIQQCDYNQYYQITANNVGIQTVQCQTCDPSCNSCTQNGPQYCQSCQNSDYLSVSSQQQYGQCLPRVQQQQYQNYKIFVLGSRNDPNFQNWQDTSSLSYDSQVTTDLLSAIYQAYQYSANQTKVNVHILMETGLHVINKNNIYNFNQLLNLNKQIDRLNLNLNLEIKPFMCSDNSYSSKSQGQYRCQLDPSVNQRAQNQNQVQILNKVGNQFNIQIPQSLNISGIIFDGIDSIQIDSSTGQPQDQQNCFWQQTNSSQPLCLSNQQTQINLNQICEYRNFGYLFYFGNINKTISTYDDIQRLNISNCTFQNIYYEMGSFVRLPQLSNTDLNPFNITLPYNISITQTNFLNISNCGSIISNDYPILNTTQSTSSTKNYIQMYLKGATNQIKTNFVLASNQIINLNCSAGNYSIDGRHCYSIQFINNNINNLNQLKLYGNQYQQQYFNWKVINQMEKFGIFMTLKQYLGYLVIQNNTFQNNQMYFTDICQFYNGTSQTLFQQPSIDLTQSSNLIGNSSLMQINDYLGSVNYRNQTYQLHSIISLEQIHSEALIQILNNNFLNNQMSSSIIQISQNSSTTQNITISGNYFYNSGSYINSNILSITIKTLNSFNLVAQSNINILYNIFDTIYSGCLSQSSIFQIQRLDYQNVVNITTQSPIQRIILTSQWKNQGIGSANISNNIFKNIDFSNLTDWSFYNISSQNSSGNLIQINDLQNIQLLNNSFINIQTPDQFNNFQKFQNQTQNLIQLQQNQTNSQSYNGIYSLINFKNNIRNIDISYGQVQQITIYNNLNYFQLIQFYEQTYYNNQMSLSIRNNSFSNINGIKKMFGNIFNSQSWASLQIQNCLFINIQMAQQNNSDGLIEFSSQNITASNLTFTNVSGSLQQIQLNDFNQMSSIFKFGLPQNNSYINIQNMQQISQLQYFGSFLTISQKYNQTFQQNNNTLIILNSNFSQMSEKLINLQPYQQNQYLNIQITNSILLLSNNTQYHQGNNQGPINLQSQYQSLTIQNCSILSTDLQNWMNNSNSQTIFNIQNQNSSILFNNFTIDFQQDNQNQIFNNHLFQYISQQHTLFNISGFNQQNILNFQNIQVQNWNDNNSRIFLIDNSSSNFSLNINNSLFQNINGQSPGLILSLGPQNYNGNFNLLVNNSQFINNFVQADANSAGLFYFNSSQSSNSTLIFNNSIFKNNFASGQTILGAYNGLFSIQFLQSIIDSNSAQQANAFGLFTDINLLGSTLQIANSSFTNNQVKNGSSILTLSDFDFVQISQSNFSNNLASQGTSGIKITSFGNFSNIINEIFINSVQFINSNQNQNSMQTINGSYIQIMIPKSSQSYLWFNPKISIINTIFQSGYSIYGGAIYYGSYQIGQQNSIQAIQQNQMQSQYQKRRMQQILTNLNSQNQFTNLSLTIFNSSFIQNQANYSGGAIYIDELDYYNLQISSSIFQSNKGNFYGDNLFFQQTQQSNGLSQNQRIINISFCNFSTPITFNQLYFTNIEIVNLEKSNFGTILSSQCQEGASIYSKNTYQMTISSSIFFKQQALVRGGAIMVQQKNQSYFGSSYGQSLYVFKNNLFQSCQAQSGGSIYFDSVSNILLLGNNKFTNNRVLMYPNQTNNFYQQLDAAHYKNIDKLDPLKNGKGSAILFSCLYNSQCNLTIKDGSQFDQNNIYAINIDAINQYQQSKYSKFQNQSIFFDNSIPNVPVSLQNQLVQIFDTSTKGTQMIFINNQTLIDQMNNFINYIIMNGQNYQYQEFNFTSFINLFKTQNNSNDQFQNISSFQKFNPISTDPQSSIIPSYFFGGYLAVIDDQYQLQIYDNQSKININCDQLVLNSNYQANQPIKSFCKQENGQLQSYMEFMAINGVIQIPKIYIQSMPGQKLFINLSAQIINQQSQNQFNPNELLEVDITSCLADQIINKSGLCQTCQGPNYHNPFVLQSQMQISKTIQECSQCFTQAFTCNSGSNVSINDGYQRLDQTDVIVKCQFINDFQTCIKNSTCRAGYTGIQCNKCQQNYYKYTDGSCQKCSNIFNYNINTSLNIFELILLWASFIIIIMILQTFILQGQNQNQLSIVLYFFKNIVNYVIVTQILFDIFRKYWNVDPQSALRTQINQINTQFFIQFQRNLYMHPYYLTIIMIQCQFTGGQNNFNGIQIHEQVGNVMILILLILLIINILYQLFSKNELMQFLLNDKTKLENQNQLNDQKQDIDQNKEESKKLTINERQSQIADFKIDDFRLKTDSDFNESSMKQRKNNLNSHQNSLQYFREINNQNFPSQKRSESAFDLLQNQGFNFQFNSRIDKLKEKSTEYSQSYRIKDIGRDQPSIKERPESKRQIQKQEIEELPEARQESEESVKLQFIYQQKLSSIDEKSQDEIQLDENSNDFVKMEDFQSREYPVKNRQSINKKQKGCEIQDSHSRQISILENNMHVQDSDILPFQQFQRQDNNLFLPSQQTQYQDNNLIKDNIISFQNDSNLQVYSQNSNQQKQDLNYRINETQKHLILNQNSETKHRMSLSVGKNIQNNKMNEEKLNNLQLEGGENDEINENIEEEKLNDDDQNILSMPMNFQSNNIYNGKLIQNLIDYMTRNKDKQIKISYNFIMSIYKVLYLIFESLQLILITDQIINQSPQEKQKNFTFVNNTQKQQQSQLIKNKEQYSFENNEQDISNNSKQNQNSQKKLDRSLSGNKKNKNYSPNKQQDHQSFAYNIDMLRLQKHNLQMQSLRNQQLQQKQDIAKKNKIDAPVQKMLQINRTLYSSPYCDDIMNQLLVSATLRAKKVGGSLKVNKNVKAKQIQNNEQKKFQQKFNLNTAHYKEEAKITQKIQDIQNENQFEKIKKNIQDQQIIIKEQQEQENNQILEIQYNSEIHASNKKQQNIIEKQLSQQQSNTAREIINLIDNKNESIERMVNSIYDLEELNVINNENQNEDQLDQIQDQNLQMQQLPLSNVSYQSEQIDFKQQEIIDDNKNEPEFDPYQIQENKKKEIKQEIDFNTPKVIQTSIKTHQKQASIHKSDNPHNNSEFLLQNASISQSQIGFMSNPSQAQAKKWNHQFIPIEKNRRQSQKTQFRKQLTVQSQKLMKNNDFNHSDDQLIVKGINNQMNNQNYLINDEYIAQSSGHFDNEDDFNGQKKENQIILDKYELEKNELEEQEKMFQKYKFDKITIFIILMIFLLNTQIVESFTILFSCQIVQQVQFNGLVTQIQINQEEILQNYTNYNQMSIDGKLSYSQMSDSNLIKQLGKNLNIYDSSYECSYDQIQQQQKFYAIIGHAIIWLILAPIYVLYRSPREYAIEISFIIVKSLLIVVAKYTINYQENFAYLGVGILLVFQFLFFIIFKNSQTQIHAEQIDDLQLFNFIDLSMWICIIVSYLIGIVQFTSHLYAGSIASDIMLVLLMITNFTYLAVFSFTICYRIYKTIKLSPKFVVIILIFTCQFNKIKELIQKQIEVQQNDEEKKKEQEQIKKPGIVKVLQNFGSGIQLIEKELEKEINQNELEEEARKKEIRRIEKLIQQLMMQQKQLQSGSASRYHEDTSVFSVQYKGFNASKNGSVSNDTLNQEQFTQSNRKIQGKQIQLHNQLTDQLSSNDNQILNNDLNIKDMKKFILTNQNSIIASERAHIFRKKNQQQIRPEDDSMLQINQWDPINLQLKNEYFNNQIEKLENQRFLNMSQQNNYLSTKFNDDIIRPKNQRIKKPVQEMQILSFKGKQGQIISKNYEIVVSQDSDNKEQVENYIEIKNNTNEQDIRKTINFESIDFTQETIDFRIQKPYEILNNNQQLNDINSNQQAAQTTQPNQNQQNTQSVNFITNNNQQNQLKDEIIEDQLSDKHQQPQNKQQDGPNDESPQNQFQQQ